jgi:hypothetical protein
LKFIECPSPDLNFIFFIDMFAPKINTLENELPGYILKCDVTTSSSSMRERNRMNNKKIEMS